MQQCIRPTAYEEHTTATSRELEWMRHENVVHRSGAHPPSEQDRELQVAYRRLSEAEHGWQMACNTFCNLCMITKLMNKWMFTFCKCNCHSFTLCLHYAKLTSYST
jgi:hypothetical protein